MGVIKDDSKELEIGAIEVSLGSDSNIIFELQI